MKEREWEWKRMREKERDWKDIRVIYHIQNTLSFKNCDVIGMTKSAQLYRSTFNSFNQPKITCSKMLVWSMQASWVGCSSNERNTKWVYEARDDDVELEEKIMADRCEKKKKKKKRNKIEKETKGRRRDKEKNRSSERLQLRLIVISRCRSNGRTDGRTVSYVRKRTYVLCIEADGHIFAVQT